MCCIPCFEFGVDESRSPPSLTKSSRVGGVAVFIMQRKVAEELRSNLAEVRLAKCNGTLVVLAPVPGPNH